MASRRAGEGGGPGEGQHVKSRREVAALDHPRPFENHDDGGECNDGRKGAAAEIERAKRQRDENDR